jgi:hypothetical protein
VAFHDDGLQEVGGNPFWCQAGIGVSASLAVFTWKLLPWREAMAKPLTEADKGFGGTQHSLEGIALHRACSNFFSWSRHCVNESVHRRS